MLAAEARVVELTAENVGLVDALESEKRICSTWSKTAEANSEKLEKAQQRIVRLEEMESRTVKLPDSNSEQFWGYGAEFDIKLYDSCVFHALTATGIKWEVK
ncbi:hypothetical protein [Klebsiella phage BUCT_49532]|uniref:hypothetical protein n=1 Tax=Klebsiella phage BUCT_49532 TaxID=2849971 RepID=UPI001C767B42|nr:hypothetical protein PQZ56_gp71 [Klebsiella phage BUCT_49532]WCI99766.1 hypothetical protein [Klebsiella phage BUCT_49532]